MSRRIWIVLATLAVIGAIGSAVAVKGLQYYLVQRNATWLANAEAQYAHGDLEHAKKNYELVIPHDPANRALLEKYATVCERLTTNRISALQSAATAYQQILGYYPSSPEVRKKLIDLYSKMEAWSTLEYYTEEWLTASPQDPDLSYYHALALDRMGRRDDAIEAYQALASGNTEHSDVYGNLARLLRDRGLEPEADAVLKKAVETRPNDARVRVDYARFLARSRDWPRMETLLNEALQVAPNDAQVLLAHAQAAALHQDVAGAIDFAKRAISANPTDPNSYLVLSGAYSKQGNVDDAINTIRQIDPIVLADNPTLLISLVDIELSANRFDEAHKTIEQYTTAYPDELPVIEYFKGKELLVRGEPAAAVKKLVSVVQLRPNFMLAEYALAVAYLETGELDIARSTLESYISRNPTDERAQRLMAQRFGKPTSLPDLEAKAAGLVGDATASSEQLRSVAVALFDTAGKSGALADHADAVKKLLEAAIAKDPTLVESYRSYVDFLLSQRDVEAAKAIVERAQKAGIDDASLAMSRAGIALGAGDANAAKAIFETVTGTGFGRENYEAWSNLFARYGKLDLAFDVLDRGIAAITAVDARQDLEIDRFGATVQSGDLAKASTESVSLAAEVGATSPQRRQFNRVRLQLADALLGKNDNASASQAEQIVKSVRDEEPQNQSLLALEGALLMRKTPADLDAAEGLFERAATVPGGNLTAEWGLARIALAHSDYPRALARTERALALSPQSSALLVQHADILLKLGRPKDAESALNAVLAQRPDDPSALHLLATSYLDANEADKAKATIDHLERVISGKPGADTAIAELRGRLLMAQGAQPEAEALLRAQVKANPEDFNAVRNLALAIHAQGRTVEAELLIETYAQDHASNPETWVALAQFYEAGSLPDRLERASTALTRALLADSNCIPAIREMLGVRIRQGALSEALGLCDRYLSRNPDDADMLNTKAGLLLDTGNQTDKAMTTIDRAIELEDKPQYRLTRGLVLVGMQDYQRALRELQPIVSGMHPTPARIDIAMAEVYLATGDIAQAKEYYGAASRKAAGGEQVNANQLKRIGDSIKERESKV